MGREKPITSIALLPLCRPSNPGQFLLRCHFVAVVLPRLTIVLTNEIRAKKTGERKSGTAAGLSFCFESKFRRQLVRASGGHSDDFVCARLSVGIDRGGVLLGSRRSRAGGVRLSRGDGGWVWQGDSGQSRAQRPFPLRPQRKRGKKTPWPL